VTLLGTLLKNRRCGETDSAWNRPNLQGPELLTVSSRHFEEGEPIPLEHAGKRIGGKNLSPHLSWNAPPPETTELLLVVEDLDVPTTKPAVHCLVLITPSRLESPNHLAPGGLSAHDPAPGVRAMRSTITRGYHGPEPIKGHGPHRYSFQLFALLDETSSLAESTEVHRARPHALLSSISSPVLARGRLTGVYER
jgi:phosphatidylethanolamine-binding protein (PEBP) family uncharacterized protein